MSSYVTSQKSRIKIKSSSGTKADNDGHPSARQKVALIVRGGRAVTNQPRREEETCSHCPHKHHDLQSALPSTGRDAVCLPYLKLATTALASVTARWVSKHDRFDAKGPL
jgi:hypothetical protein